MDVIKKEKIEVMRRHMGDGIIESLIGFVLCVWGVLALHHSYLLSIAWLPLFIVKPLKNLITYPRLGYHSLSVESKRVSNFWVMAILAGILLLAIFVITDDSLAIFIRNHSSRIFLNVFVNAGLISFVLTRVYRFLGYIAASIAASLLLGPLPEGIHYSFIAVGGVILVSGIITMTIFIAKNPIQAHE